MRMIVMDTGKMADAKYGKTKSQVAAVINELNRVLDVATPLMLSLQDQIKDALSVDGSDVLVDMVEYERACGALDVLEWFAGNIDDSELCERLSPKITGIEKHSVLSFSGTPSDEKRKKNNEVVTVTERTGNA